MLSIPTKPRYGLRALLDIAMHERPGNPVLLRDIAKRQQISDRYLEHVLTSLRNAGLVKSIRGAKGGYFLGKLPAEITVMDVFRATAGAPELVECIAESGSCNRSDMCATRILWTRVHDAMSKVMQETTLEELVRMQQSLETPVASMFYI